MKTYKLSSSLICSGTRLDTAVSMTESSGVDIIHLDVFLKDLDANTGFSIEQISKIRHLTRLPLDIHILLTSALPLVRELHNTGNIRFLIHFESQDFVETIDFLATRGIDFGVAIKPSTPFIEVLPWLAKSSTLLVFTVVPGKRGQTILPNALARVHTIREALSSYPNCSLQVDGGVYLDSIGQLANAGADTFVVGSALYSLPGTVPAEAAKLLRETLRRDCA